jgi:hypothetical protein
VCLVVSLGTTYTRGGQVRLLWLARQQPMGPECTTLAYRFRGHNMPNNTYTTGFWTNGTIQVELACKTPRYTNRATRVSDGVRVIWVSILAPDPFMRQHPAHLAASAYSEFVVIDITQ